MKFKKEYIVSNGVFCPYCRSYDIEGQIGFEMSDTGITQNVECNNCHKKWTDIYRLVDVEEMEE